MWMYESALDLFFELIGDSSKLDGVLTRAPFVSALNKARLVG